MFLHQLAVYYEGRGDKNYDQAHNQGEKRHKETSTAVVNTVDISVNYEDYIACKDILARYNAQRPI